MITAEVRREIQRAPRWRGMGGCGPTRTSWMWRDVALSATSYATMNPSPAARTTGLLALWPMTVARRLVMTLPFNVKDVIAIARDPALLVSYAITPSLPLRATEAARSV